jgi:serine/threonine protein kinase
VADEFSPDVEKGGAQTGIKLRPYEILSPISAGCMGEVYRAKDTRLERAVAIKVLPAHLSSDPELKQRMNWLPRSLHYARSVLRSLRSSG